MRRMIFKGRGLVLDAGLVRGFSSKAYTNRKYGEKVPPRDRKLPTDSKEEKRGILPEFLVGEFDDYTR